VGIEWAFAPNWSAKFEYDYLGLNSRTFTVPGGGFLAGDTFTISNPNVQTVKVGINYLFNYGVGRLLIAESSSLHNGRAPAADASSTSLV
jgi:hypothetical protein